IIDRYLSDILEVEQVLKKGDIGLVVVFGGNFSENLNRGTASVQLIADGSDPNTASSLANYATAIINQLTSNNEQLILNGGQIPRINCELKLLYNPTMKGAYNTVPGVFGLIFMLICTMMTSISIAREKEQGSMEVLLVSPVKPFTIILSKTIPYFVLSLINFTTMLLLSVFILKVPVVGSLGLLTGLVMLFVFLCLSLGVLISIVAPSQIVATIVSAVVMMMPTMLLSGLMFPIENMPLVLQWFAQIFPVKWFIEAARAIMIQGSGIASIAKELMVLCGMTIFLLFISVKKFNKRLA
ncbi:MAG: ABC transporter permease, partial [Bacteroidales bacterium]|nr:ABC transporter permease [Bacteroidales bacterium]